MDVLKCSVDERIFTKFNWCEIFGSIPKATIARAPLLTRESIFTWPVVRHRRNSHNTLHTWSTSSLAQLETLLGSTHNKFDRCRYLGIWVHRWDFKRFMGSLSAIYSHQRQIWHKGRIDWLCRQADSLACTDMMIKVLLYAKKIITGITGMVSDCFQPSADGACRTACRYSCYPHPISLLQNK